MQVLQLKKRDAQNKEIIVGVKVLRSWHDASGQQVYLHSDGLYGYKDGSPIRRREDLDIIGSPVHRSMALRWWESTGKKYSEKFYRAIADAEAARVEDFYEATSQTELDQVLYRVRAKTKKGEKKTEWSEPFTWMERFPARPDWWGQAEQIVLKGYEYDLSIDEPAGDLAPGEV